MHFSWEWVPQLTQVRCQYEVSSGEGKEKNNTHTQKERGRGLFYIAWKRDVNYSRNAFASFFFFFLKKNGLADEREQDIRTQHAQSPLPTAPLERQGGLLMFVHYADVHHFSFRGRQTNKQPRE